MPVLGIPRIDIEIDGSGLSSPGDFANEILERWVIDFVGSPHRPFPGR